MKMNKLAAGALALALGLGAVAPAVAAEKEYTGAELVLEKYNKELKDVNALREKAIDAQAKIDVAEKRLEDAKAKVAEKQKAYKALFPANVEVLDEDGEAISVEELDKKVAKEAEAIILKALDATEGTFIFDVDVQNYKGDLNTREKLSEHLYNHAEAKGYKVDTDQKKAAVERYINAVIDYAEGLKDEDSRLLAYQELQSALLEKDAAITNLKEVKAKNNPIVGKYEDAFKELSKLAAQYGALVQVGNNGVQIVNPDDSKVDAPNEEFNIEELRAAREKAVITLEAVKLLEKLTPEKIADVKDQLDELVEEQKDLIKKADKYLDKEIALFSTAYAAEDDEEMSAEELTDKLNEKSDKIQDLISDDKEDEEKPAEDDKEDDEKPAEDDKEDEEEPAEDDKEDEEKPAENKPSKGAGNNAKTGIAGVAGVAGILAAASVAYATSKRD